MKLMLIIAAVAIVVEVAGVIWTAWKTREDDWIV